MPATPDDFLAIARGLAKLAHDPSLDEGLSDALCRRAVSSAYYAAFHLTVQWAMQGGFTAPSGMGSHSALWAGYCKNAGHHPIVGDEGLALGQRRIQADYYLGQVLTVSAEDAIEDAEAIMEMIAPAL